MNMKKEKLLEALWYIAIFAFFYIWFSKIHPLVVYDSDDWTYIAYARRATPIWGEWNPAKVFPEVLLPFFSNIILYTLVPLTGDYITGFTVGHALVVSGFITVYTWALVALLRRSFSLSGMTGIFSGTLFLIFHFLVFRTQNSGNSYLFHCDDLNCYYNYLLPALLNAILIMYVIGNPDFEKLFADAPPVKVGIIYILIYFAIFSNMAISGMLASLAGSYLLLNLLKTLKKFKLMEYIKSNAHWLIILGMWCVSVVYEFSGGRATNAAAPLTLGNLRYTAYCLKEVLVGCNPLFWLSVFTIIVLAALQFLLTKKKAEEEATLLNHLVPLLVAAAALLVYMLALCTIVWFGTIYRSEYQITLFFYGFLVVFLALGYLLKKQPKLMFLLPLLVIFLASDINTNEMTFEDSLMSDYGAQACADISRDIINQYVEADLAGLTETTIYIPMHIADPETEDNWPHTMVLLPRIGNALYKQGVLSRPISANFVIDPAVNQRHNIPVPTAE